MKTRNILSLLLAVSMVLSMNVSAFAASIFDLLPVAPSKVEVVAAPSYGNLSGSEPDESAKNTDGGTILTYKDVSMDDFERFGVYLAQLDYSVTEQQVREEQDAYTLSNGSLSFTTIYDNATQTLYVIYPEGTESEEIMFPGYKRVMLGEKIKLENLGDYTFNGFQMIVSDLYTAYGLYEKESTGAMLTFAYYNSSQEHKFFPYKRTEKVENDKFYLLQAVELAYYAEDDNYYFDYDAAGKIENGKINRDTQRYERYDQDDIGIAFKLPDFVMDSTGGTIGMKFENRSVGEKYVLVLRENGKNLY